MAAPGIFSVIIKPLARFHNKNKIARRTSMNASHPANRIFESQPAKR